MKGKVKKIESNGFWTALDTYGYLCSTTHSVKEELIKDVHTGVAVVWENTFRRNGYGHCSWIDNM